MMDKMEKIRGWLDERTGYRNILQHVLEENIPCGSRWRYVWGSTLVFTLTIQVITGLVLWMAYSPSSQTAWASVYYIQYEMQGVWLLRGMHHFAAQVMILLLGLHLLQVVVDNAYTAPREVNFWFGLILLHLVLALSLTGYLLPWDQKGFWATKVATNILIIAPGFGEDLARLLIGGTEYGHHTLTRFFALHAGVLPLLVFALLGGHIYLFRRHGIKTRFRPQVDEKFWPEQVLKDAVACLVVLATLLVLIYRNRIFNLEGPLGAELGAPADPTEPYSAARPEWYFLFMFQFLKLFPGGTEVWGAIIIPNLVLLFLFLMPLLGRYKWGHRLNLGAMGGLAAGAVLLTFMALQYDRQDPEYQAAVRQAHQESQRAALLAQSPIGVPMGGGLALLRNDPLTQGPKLFARNCASCHRYDGHDGLGRTLAETPTASDLKGFGSREWLTGLLDPKQFGSPRYFGGTAFTNGAMARFLRLKVAKYSPEDRDNLKKVVLAVSAEAQLPAQKQVDHQEAKIIEEGRGLLQDRLKCTDCHRFHGDQAKANAPDLTGYGSREWLTGFLNNPAHPRFYGTKNDRMPAFGEQHILDDHAIGLIADWLRDDYFMPEKQQIEVAGQGRRELSGNQ